MKHRGTRYALELALLALGLLVILAAPDFALSVIVFALPSVLFGAGIGVLYLRRVYLFQPEPRSRFFGMLVSISTRLWFLGLWFGYLVLGRIGERTGRFELPIPPIYIANPISGLVLGVFIAPPIFYAWRVWRIRRIAEAGSGTPAEDEEALDRG